MNIYLIGYRATGKSSVGRLLARRLGPPWEFYDVDRRIEQVAGMDIASIFRTLGEPTFRNIERDVVAEFANREHCVVALGGGTLNRSENRDVVHCGWCVWLTASPQTIHARMSADPATASTRPALTEFGGLREIELLLEEREPIYREMADMALDTESLPIAELAARIEETFLHEQSSLSGEKF